MQIDLNCHLVDSSSKFESLRPMDTCECKIQLPNQPRLYIHMILSCRMGAFSTAWGIVCSSWVQMNVFTSCRSLINPDGDCSKKYVEQANKMVSRTLCYQIEFIQSCWWSVGINVIYSLTYTCKQLICSQTMKSEQYIVKFRADLYIKISVFLIHFHFSFYSHPAC